MMTNDAPIVAAGAALRATRAAVGANQRTTEAFIHGVRSIAVNRARTLGRITADEADRLMATKLVYGVGAGTGARGVCYYGIWRGPDGSAVDMVEITALGQESWVQLAGTTIHELAHVIAGHSAGHSIAWADRGTDLGFVKRPKAAGQTYWLPLFSIGLRDEITALVRTLTDGQPNLAGALGYGTGFRATAPRPCSAGVGTRGGTSRGIGSGSRMVLWLCQCERPAKVRAAVGSGLDATCNRCGSALVAQSS